MQALLAGHDLDLSFVVLADAGVSPFEAQVYAAARMIRRGQTRTYGEVARGLGDPGAARAVGAALGRNPWPIVVPCHRVLAANGATGGFSAPGGVSTKLRLLQIEQAGGGAGGGLFDNLPLAIRPR